MEKCERGTAGRLQAAAALFVLLRGKAARVGRWIQQLGPVSASRSRVVRLLLAALLLITDLTSTVGPAFAQSNSPSLSGRTVGQGVAPSGAFFLDLQLTNNSSSARSGISIAELPLRTLSGTGTVTYNSTLSPALPILVGNLLAGASTTIRLYFNVPSTVTRFSVTENGTVQDPAGTTLSFSIAQSVIPGTPRLASVNPSNAQQGQQNLNVQVTGQFTHFVQGTTQISFGAGITVNGAVVANATSLAANISIDAGAAIGSRTVTATTGTEAASLLNGFTVLPKPVLLTVNPASGRQAQQNLSIQVTGQFTSFVQGTTQVSFGAGISVGTVTVTDASHLTAQIIIDAAAVLGARTVSATTSSEVASLPDGFSVLPGTPVILSVDPNSGFQGQQPSGTVGSIFLTGHDPDFHAFAGGSNATGAVNINRAAINFVTDPAFNTFAARGIRKFLYVTSSTPPGGHVDGTNGLISSGYVLGRDFDRSDASTLTSALGQLGTTYDALVIASDFGGILTQAELDVLNAHSADIINFLNQGGGIYAMAQTAPPDGLASSGFFGFLPFAVASSPVQQSESGITLTPFGASLGLTNSDVNGNFSHSVFTSTGGLNVVDTDPIGEILSLAGRGKVTSGGVGSVLITGQFTHFAPGTTQVDFGSGITVGTVSVADATHLTARIAIDPNAVPSGRTVTAITGGEIASLANGFTVLARPQLLTISPNTGQQGQQNLNVQVTGQSTNFAQGTTLVSFGAGITVNSVTVTNATSPTANISIDTATATGTRTVTATTGTEVASLANGFTVNPGTTVLLTVSPNNGQQGQLNLNVQVTGQFTNFAQGTTQVSFGAGITVNSVTVANKTSLTANISIGGGAPVGSRTVTATTAAEVASLVNGFNVTPGTPALLTVNPNGGQQGQQNLNIQVTSQFTNFAQGTTQVSFGTGITVNTVTVANATSLTANISIAGNAALSGRTLTVTTGAEVVSLANAFAVGAG